MIGCVLVSFFRTGAPLPQLEHSAENTRSSPSTAAETAWHSRREPVAFFLRSDGISPSCSIYGRRAR